MSCGVGRRHSSNPMLLWLWCRPAAAALGAPLAWEPPYASDVALKRQKKKERERERDEYVFHFCHGPSTLLQPDHPQVSPVIMLGTECLSPPRIHILNPYPPTLVMILGGETFGRELELDEGMWVVKRGRDRGWLSPPCEDTETVAVNRPGGGPSPRT